MSLRLLTQCTFQYLTNLYPIGARLSLLRGLSHNMSATKWGGGAVDAEIGYFSYGE